MKTFHLICIALLGMFTTFTVSAQNNVGIGTTSPDASALLELYSTNQGFLPPRLSSTQRDAMPIAPATTIATGLVIYCTDCVPNGILQVYNGTAWTDMCGGTIGPPLTVQQRLDAGETPIFIYNSLVADGATSVDALDSLYGKTYQGGLIAYLDIVNGTGLIAAATDQSTNIQWTMSAYQSITVPNGAQFTTLGNANTVSIVGQAGVPAASGDNYAAYLCDSLTLGGYTDWYLPSYDELNYLWENLADSDGDNSNTGPTDPNNLGGFAANYYWSSTENVNIFARGHNFTSGSQPNGRKYFTDYVRAVRAF
jgi:hypothetical protein